MKSRWLDTGAGRCSRRVLGTALAIAWCTAPRAVHAQDDILEAEEAAGEGLEEGGESGLEPEGAGEDLDAATEPQSEAPAIFDDSMLEAGVEGGALEGGAESAASDGEVFVDDDIEEITVTGSRIKRTIFSAAAPVEVMNREQIEKTGSQNMEDLLQHMTISTGSGYRGGGGGPGTAQVNLRGLGAGATLVLINGRRVVPSAAGITVAFTDISTIPLSVVERVEVLKGGASAIYGSDAIAGVVNIITRKDWQGVRVQADGRATTNEFDQRAGTVSVAMGASAGDVRVTGGISYYRSTQLLANKRDFTLEEGPDGGQGGNRSLGGQPGTYIAGGLIADPNCDSVPGSRVEMTDVGDLCSFSFNDFRALTPNTERTALYLHGEYDLSDHTRMFMEANVSKTRTDAISSPSFSFTIRPVIPADHVDNPFGVDATFIGRPLGAASGGAITETDDDTLRTAFGFRGDLEDIAANTFFETWSWELFTTFGVSRYSRFLPDTVFPDFVEAVNSCTDASDLSECFNPFAAGTPNPTSVTRGFTGALMTTVDQHLQTYNAGMSGTLLELPGGDLGIAFGGALRQEQRTSQLDHDTNEFDLSFYFGDDDAEAERDVIAGYMELVLPFYEGIEMQAAARVEDYSDAGSAVNPGVGLVLMPGTIAGSDSESLRSLQIRANAARAFRAPGLYQSFNGSTTVPASLDEGGPAPIFRPVRREGNPNLDPETALALSAGVSWAPAFELSLTADYWRYQYDGFISPENAQKVLNDELAARAIDPAYSDPRVQRDENGALERIVVQHVNIPGEIMTHGIDTNVMTRYDTDGAGILNLGAQITYQLAYEIPRDQIAEISVDDGMGGSMQVDLPFCDGETCDVSGNLNDANIAPAQPKLRLNLPIGWTMGGHSAGAVLHYMSAVDDWAPARYDAVAGGRTVDSFVTLDAQYGYTFDGLFGKLTQLRVGVYNLLDQPPPFADVLDSYVAALHDPRGRMVYANITQEF